MSRRRTRRSAPNPPPFGVPRCHTEQVTRPPVRTAALVVGLSLTLAAGCIPGPGPTPTATGPSPSASASRTTGPTPTPTTVASPTPTGPSPSPSASPVVALTATGVGPLTDGTPVGLADLESVLGPSDSSGPDPCAPDSVASSWGSLVVTTIGGELHGWAVNRSAPLGAGLGVPAGVVIGSPLSAVLAMPGAGAPTFDEAFGLWFTTVGTPPADLVYVTDTDAPDSPVVAFGHHPILCG